jgi:hypothetical protein
VGSRGKFVAPNESQSTNQPTDQPPSTDRVQVKSELTHRSRDFEKLYDLVRNQRNKFVALIAVAGQVRGRARGGHDGGGKKSDFKRGGLIDNPI